MQGVLMVFNCYVNDIEYRATNRYNIKQQAGAISTSELDILVEDGQPVPSAFMSVELSKDGTPFFWGVIMSVETPEYSSGYEVRLFRVTVQSGEVVFNNRLVSEAYQDMFAHEIVVDLFTNYIAMEGFTLGTISTTTQKYEDYNCSFTKLYDVLNELATDCNATFHVSANKVFSFIKRNEFEQVNAPEHITKLKKEEDSGELRTVQIITGAKEKTSLQTEALYWLADTTVILLGYTLTELVAITINGVQAEVGIRGVDEENTDKTFLYQIASNTITLNYNATVKPSAGDNVVVLYKGFYEVIIDNRNESLIEQISELSGTSGFIENVHTDEAITNFADADLKADALLSAYESTSQTISCETNNIVNTDLYTEWVFDRLDLGIVGKFVIVERQLEDFGDNWRIKLKLANNKFKMQYGLSIKKDTKKVRDQTKVYKNSRAVEVYTVIDQYIIDHAGIVFYPSITTFTEPELVGFYPV